jgi:hypothetical protein
MDDAGAWVVFEVRKAHPYVRLPKKMVSRPPRIQLVGLLPAILKPCGPACAQPFMNRNVQSLKEAEFQETPAFVRENAERAHHLAEELFRDFGDRIRIEVVGLDSPRGLWLGLRHGVSRGFAVIVDGRDVFRDPGEYDPVKGAVSRAISLHGAPG